MYRSLNSARQRPRGFTLIELLVVMAVIGVLAGLLFPAVQSIRESARNKECLNNIRQIIFAHQAYEQINRHYAAGWVDRQVSGEPDMDFRYGWATLLLPHLEGDNLYKTYGVRAQYWGNAMDEVIVDATTPISTFICPSDPAPEMSVVWQGIQSSAGGPVELAKMNYCGNFGIGRLGGAGFALDPEIEYRTATPTVVGSGELGDAFGIFCCNSKVRHRDITDGHSTTIVFGERGGSDWGYQNPMNLMAREEYGNLLLRIGVPKSTLTPVCPVGAPLQGLGGDGSAQVAMGPMVQPLINSFGASVPVGPFGGSGPALVNTVGNDYDPRDFLINATRSGGVDPTLPSFDGSGLSDRDGDGLNAYTSGYSSGHTGGANFAFSDGSIKFINQELDLLTFQRILQRNDGSVVNLGY